MPKKQTPSAPDVAAFDPRNPYRINEDQHTALYQARHLSSLLSVFACNREEFCEARMESIAVTFGLIADLLDTAQPDLVWRPSCPR